MQQEGFEGMKSPACKEIEPLLILFAAGELDASEMAEVDEHLQHCSGCSLAMTGENEMLALLAANHHEPDASLLASCRATLDDALDQQEERGWLRRTVGALLPSSWISPRPAWSAALLLAIGFSVGVLGPRLLRHPSTPSGTDSLTASNISAPQPLDNAPTSLLPLLSVRSICTRLTLRGSTCSQRPTTSRRACNCR